MPAATDRNVLGILGYRNDYPSPADLREFMTACRTDAVDATYAVKLVNGGGYDPSHPGLEASLDMQYAQAMAYPTRHIFYSTGGGMVIHDNEPDAGDRWLEWLVYVLSDPNIPQTISDSYSDSEKNLPREYATTLCYLYAELGVRGASVIFASGDFGVGGGNCIASDGSGRVQFIPEFPPSCMCSVLSLLGSGTPSQAQVAHHISTASQVPMSLAWAARQAISPRSRLASLGAASRTTFCALPTRIMLCTPSYSASAASMMACTSGFSATTSPNLVLSCNFHGLCSAAGRGYPDISAQALDFFVIRADQDYITSGTSCAAPVRLRLLPLLYVVRPRASS